MIPNIQIEVIGQGKPLVFLHAFPLSRRLFHGLQAPKGYAWVLPDFPGFGLSPNFHGDLTLYQAAQGLENALKSLGINEKISLGGISMGGYWAFEYLNLFPERVSQLILVSTRSGVDKPEGRQNRLAMADRALQEGVDFIVEAMTPGLLGATTRTQKPEVTAQLAQWIREAGPEGVANAQRAMAQRRDQGDPLKNLDLPTLILAGQEDRLIPSSEAQAMAGLVKGSRLEILPQVGHLIPMEAPKAFETSLQNFLIAGR